MESLNLLSICISAFGIVFILLSILALMMRLIILFFPEKDVSGDSAVLAAISTAYQSLYPGMQITKVEEQS